MTISIIIPLYYGEKYLKNLIQMLEKNELNLPIGYRLQIVFVKDSDEELNINNYMKGKKNIIFIQNEKNMGIHYSRVKGISVSSGEYIHMLDQDDEISDDFYLNCINKIKNADVVVCNGMEQRNEYSKVLYKYYIMQYTVKFSFFYTKFSCRIISPGQCMIRKSSIPKEWMGNIIRENGADDAMLWLMMLHNKKKFAINRKIEYIHVNTGCNTSLNIDKMNSSVIEVRDVLKRLNMISDGDLKRLDKQINNSVKSKLVMLVEKINKYKEK